MKQEEAQENEQQAKETTLNSKRLSNQEVSKLGYFTKS